MSAYAAEVSEFAEVRVGRLLCDAVTEVGTGGPTAPTEEPTAAAAAAAAAVEKLGGLVPKADCHMPPMYGQLNVEPLRIISL